MKQASINKNCLLTIPMSLMLNQFKVYRVEGGGWLVWPGTPTCHSLAFSPGLCWLILFIPKVTPPLSGALPLKPLPCPTYLTEKNARLGHFKYRLVTLENFNPILCKSTLKKEYDWVWWIFPTTQWFINLQERMRVCRHMTFVKTRFKSAITSQIKWRWQIVLDQFL